MTSRIRLAGEIGAPQHNLRRVLTHVFFGIGLQRPRNPQAKCPKAPADNRPAPGLATVQIGKAFQVVPTNAGAVVGT